MCDSLWVSAMLRLTSKMKRSFDLIEDVPSIISFIFRTVCFKCECNIITNWMQTVEMRWRTHSNMRAHTRRMNRIIFVVCLLAVAVIEWESVVNLFSLCVALVDIHSNWIFRILFRFSVLSLVFAHLICGAIDLHVCERHNEHWTVRVH